MKTKIILKDGKRVVIKYNCVFEIIQAIVQYRNIFGIYSTLGRYSFLIDELIGMTQSQVVDIVLEKHKKHKEYEDKKLETINTVIGVSTT